LVGGVFGFCVRFFGVAGRLFLDLVFDERLAFVVLPLSQETLLQHNPDAFFDRFDLDDVLLLAQNLLGCIGTLFLHHKVFDTFDLSFVQMIIFVSEDHSVASFENLIVLLFQD
jgi:hypothetical protein